MLSMPRIVRPDSSGGCRMKVGSPAGLAPANPLSRTKNWRNVPVSPPPSQEISLQGKTVVSELGCHHKLSLLDASALTSQYSRPNGRITNVTSRYWQYRLHAPLREPGHVDDAGAC